MANRRKTGEVLVEIQDFHESGESAVVAEGGGAPQVAKRRGLVSPVGVLVEGEIEQMGIFPNSRPGTVFTTGVESVHPHLLDSQWAAIVEISPRWDSHPNIVKLTVGEPRSEVALKAAYRIASSTAIPLDNQSQPASTNRETSKIPINHRTCVSRHKRLAPPRTACR